MNSRLFLAVALAALCSAADAGQHSICYETELGMMTYPTGIYACSEDSGGACLATPLTGGMSLVQTVVPGGSSGTFWQSQFYFYAGTFSVRFDFRDRNGQPSGSRVCTINAHGPLRRGAATAGAELTGFTTDASGLVTTGVWRLKSSLSTGWNRQNLNVPADFVVVGGGAKAAESGAGLAGALIAESAPLDGAWTARTSQAAGLARSHQTTVYAIGLRIAGIDAPDLQQRLLRRIPQDGYPALASYPVNQVSFTSPYAFWPSQPNYVFLSGSAAAAADTRNSSNGLGQFLTRTAPIIVNGYSAWNPQICRTWIYGVYCLLNTAPFVNGWAVSSRDFSGAGYSNPGTVNTGMLALPPTITIPGTGATYAVVGAHVSASSAVAAHPAVDVGGLRGEFALTGIGAAVADNPRGNLLWKLEPRPDLGGASVSSQDHVNPSPAAITGYAMGIKLVPVPR